MADVLSGTRNAEFGPLGDSSRTCRQNVHLDCHPDGRRDYGSRPSCCICCATVRVQDSPLQTSPYPSWLKAKVYGLLVVETLKEKSAVSIVVNHFDRDGDGHVTFQEIVQTLRDELSMISLNAALVLGLMTASLLVLMAPMSGGQQRPRKHEMS